MPHQKLIVYCYTGKGLQVFLERKSLETKLRLCSFFVGACKFWIPACNRPTNRMLSCTVELNCETTNYCSHELVGWKLFCGHSMQYSETVNNVCSSIVNEETVGVCTTSLYSRNLCASSTFLRIFHQCHCFWTSQKVLHATNFDQLF